jgi:hypothetical protein
MTGYLMIRPSSEEHRADHARFAVRPTGSGNIVCRQMRLDAI